VSLRLAARTVIVLRAATGGASFGMEAVMNFRALDFIVGMVLFVSAGSGCGHVAFAQEPASRDEALAALDSESVDRREQGLAWFTRLGNASDAELLLDRLPAEDQRLQGATEGAIWTIWSRSGDSEIDKLLQAGVRDMNEGRMAKAVEAFTRVIERKPDFAEGWNKRATAYYLMNDLEQSLKDCDEVIKRNPRHFGALSGYGLIYIKRGEFERALEYFERALAIDPNLRGVEDSIEMIRYKMRKEGKEET
jgi:tetratricopeptide (TPR) repeat protein